MVALVIVERVEVIDVADLVARNEVLGQDRLVGELAIAFGALDAGALCIVGPELLEVGRLRSRVSLSIRVNGGPAPIIVRSAHLNRAGGRTWRAGLRRP